MADFGTATSVSRHYHVVTGRLAEKAVRDRAAAQIRDGFATYGLVYLDNHGIDFDLRNRLFERFVELTDRSAEAKGPLNAADIWFQRGWTPPNTERAVVAGGQPDFKECYFAAPVAIEPRSPTWPPLSG